MSNESPSKGSSKTVSDDKSLLKDLDEVLWTMGQQTKFRKQLQQKNQLLMSAIQQIQSLSLKLEVSDNNFRRAKDEIRHLQSRNDDNLTKNFDLSLSSRNSTDAFAQSNSLVSLSSSPSPSATLTSLHPSATNSPLQKKVMVLAHKVQELKHSKEALTWRNQVLQNEHLAMSQTVKKVELRAKDLEKKLLARNMEITTLRKTIHLLSHSRDEAEKSNAKLRRKLKIETGTKYHDIFTSPIRSKPLAQGDKGESIQPKRDTQQKRTMSSSASHPKKQKEVASNNPNHKSQMATHTTTANRNDSLPENTDTNLSPVYKLVQQFEKHLTEEGDVATTEELNRIRKNLLFNSNA
eukprot:g201.t1